MTLLVCRICGAPIESTDADGQHTDPAICQAHIDAVWATRYARAVAFLRMPRARWQKWSDLEYHYQEETDERH